MQFNKVNNPIYTAVSNYSIQDDGSISAKYVVGTGTDKDGQITDFVTICESYKYLTAEVANELVNKPMTADDIGKTPNQIMLSRIYEHLKETNEIVI